MSFHAWLIIAVLGCLAPLSGQTQEKAQDPKEEAGSHEPAPAPHGPFFVYILEDHANALAAEKRENESDQREIEDLIAQQGMNSATQAMNDATQLIAEYTVYSVWLVAIGTFLLSITLYYTRLAHEAAKGTLEVTREIGQAQTRAYISVDLIKTVPNEDWPIFTVRMTIRNTGNTPTRNLRYGGVLSVGTRGVIDRPLEEVRVHAHARRELTSGESDDTIAVTLTADTSMTEPPEVGASIKAWAIIETNFTDVFGVVIAERISCAGYSTWPADAGIPMSIMERKSRASPQGEQA